MAEQAKQLTLPSGDTAPACSAFSADWGDPFPGWGLEKYAKFVAYHKTHKWIWGEFERVALELIAEGERHWSADAVLHVVRFQCRKDKKAGEEFKVNNNASSGFARAFERKYPQHVGFFEIRETKEAA